MMSPNSSRPMMMQPYPYPQQQNGMRMEPQSWNHNPYLEEMQFGPPRQPSSMMSEMPPENNRRIPPNQRSRFFKLNKSSSLHDIAHEEANTRMRDMGGISWVDEPWNTTQSTMNQPTMNMQELLEQQRNFRRASSTKSLHQNIDPDPWASNVQMGWEQQQQMQQPHINPMLNPILFGMQGGGGGRPMANGLNRSMHELHMAHSTTAASTRGGSPTNSQKSKKSARSERFHNRVAKNKRNNVIQHESVQQPKQPQQCRPHSRSNSRSSSQQPKISSR